MPYVLAAIVVTLGLYFVLGLRRFVFLVLIPCVIAATIYGSWYYFSGQYEKDRSAEKQRISEAKGKKNWESVVDDMRRIERNARAGYSYPADPNDTSPLGVMRFEYSEYDPWNDDDVLSKVRDRYYPTIPKEKFDQWARDPYGQEKIDTYLKEPAQPK